PGPNRALMIRAIARPQIAGINRFVVGTRSEEHTSELQLRFEFVCRLLLEKKKSPELVHWRWLLGHHPWRQELAPPRSRTQSGDSSHRGGAVQAEHSLPAGQRTPLRPQSRP